jgi:hypothetical protein
MEKLAYQTYQQLNSPQKIYEHHESRAHWWGTGDSGFYKDGVKF